jgi:hypothetical protein
MKRTILVIAVIALVAVTVFGGQTLADKPGTLPTNPDISDTLNTINQTVTDTQGAVAIIDGTVNTINGTVDTIAGMLDDPNYGLAEIKAEVANIEATVNTIDGRLDTIEDKLDTIIDLIQPSLAVDLLIPDLVYTGVSFPCTYKLRNTGSMTLYDLWMEDDMGTPDTGDDYDFTVSELAPGEGYTRIVSRSYTNVVVLLVAGEVKGGGEDMLGHTAEDDYTYSLLVVPEPE